MALALVGLWQCDMLNLPGLPIFGQDFQLKKKERVIVIGDSLLRGTEGLIC